MNLEEFKYEARLLVFRLVKLIAETLADESIKKEPLIQNKLSATVLTLLIEAETLEKELDNMIKSSDK